MCGKELIMTDTDKPFTCQSTGCNLSFANADQLAVHKKKHDMMLNLGSNSKTAGFAADQTPTPTRFIRNCEEVGLFQDLQNVNPFEETFRRAVEAGNTGTLTVSEAGITDDTLHTPHIFPHIADVLSANSQILSENGVPECSSPIDIADKNSQRRSSLENENCTTVKISPSNTQGLVKDVKLSDSKNESISESIIVDDTDTSMTPKLLSGQTSPQLSINGEEVQLLLKTADGKLMQLSAIPVSDATAVSTVIQGTKQQTVVIKTEPPLNSAGKQDPEINGTSKLSFTKMKLKQVLTKSTGSQNRRLLTNSSKEETSLSRKENRSKTVDQLKKKEILERNRASSMRARAKRKAWIQQLERSVANVNETNVALQMEVKALRAEVAKLKTLLLAHKDCPVTKAMQKGNGIILGPKIISINPGLLSASSSIGSSSKRSFTSTELPIVAKKKITPIKNPIIFPKVDCSTTVPTLIKTVPTLKIMGVSQFLAEKEETKQILIVQNTARKLDETSRQIIQINPNYEIEHAASKSTGT
ncbi:hypothetical protein KM043_008100 [Ampulex compressa]|nr:hypothetical protein KM043_008100 [Ampulex compressa]